jgi:hypothetical protein
MSFFSRQGLGHGSSIGMAAGIGAMMYGMNRLSNSNNQTQASVGLGFMGVGAVGAAVGAGFNPALRSAMTRQSVKAAESAGVTSAAEAVASRVTVGGENAYAKGQNKALNIRSNIKNSFENGRQRILSTVDKIEESSKNKSDMFRGFKDGILENRSSNLSLETISGNRRAATYHQKPTWNLEQKAGMGVDPIDRTTRTSSYGYAQDIRDAQARRASLPKPSAGSSSFIGYNHVPIPGPLPNLDANKIPSPLKVEGNGINKFYRSDKNYRVHVSPETELYSI